ncbi:MAG: PEGA domain-containing protein [Verrucomicrobiota bacterium]
MPLLAFKKTLIRILLLASLLLASCKDAKKEEPVPYSKLAEIVESLHYQGRLDPVSQGSENPTLSSNTVLAIARTQDSDIPPVALKTCLEAFLARSTNDSFKVVTIEDLTGSASESLDGQPAEGSMQNFASNQQALQFALSQGIPAVLALNVDHINIREAKSSPGMVLADARGTVSLLSGTDAVRLETASGSTTQRGFDVNQMIDKALDGLAGSLAEQIANWRLPETTNANQAFCEIHARIEGLTMPSFDTLNGQPVFQNQNLPVFAEGASVEIDGVLVGQTPCTITTGRGMRKLKVYRDGLKPFEAVVNLTGKSRFDAILSPTPETLAQFNDQLAFLRALDQQQAISEATVNSINGYAKMLRQSGFRIDQRTIKDSKNLSLDKEDRPQ